jgi:hypothetical protein
LIDVQTGKVLLAVDQALHVHGPVHDDTPAVSNTRPGAPGR